MIKIKSKINQPNWADTVKLGNGALNPSVMPAGFNRGELLKSNRSGNYSGLGYILMDGPLTEAEQWDMPFVNPVFEYESQTEG